MITDLTAEQRQRVEKMKKMTPEQWESLCKGCGICCLSKIELEIEPGAAKTFYTHACCNWLDVKTKRCKIYKCRLKDKNNMCEKVDLDLILNRDLLPRTCGYVEYIYGPAPRKITVDWNNVKPEKDVDFKNMFSVFWHTILNSDTWNTR